MKNRRIYLKILLIAFVTISLSSCIYTEIGPNGPQGIEGPQGPPGLPGPEGPKGPSKPARTVFYSHWKSYIGSAAGGGDYMATIPAPKLTKSILDSVMVLVFYSAQKDYYPNYKLPYTSATGGGNFIYYEVEPGKIILRATLNYFTSSRAYRYIVIPLEDGVSLARKASPSNKTDDETYNAICDYYNIPK